MASSQRVFSSAVPVRSLGSPQLFMLLICSLFLILVGSVSALGAETTPEFGIRDKSPTVMAFTNATIVVSPTIKYDHATLVIRDGRIVSVGPNATIPDEAIVIDLQGKTVYPAFVDPYTDYGVEKTKEQRRRGNQRPQYEGHRTGANSWNDAIHSEINWISEFKPDAMEAKSFARFGYGTVQSCRLDGIFRGRGFVTTLASGLPNDVVLRPESMPFLSFNKGTSQQEYPESLMGSIALIRQTLYDLDWYEKAQAAYQRNPDQKMPEFNRSIEALEGIKSQTLLFDPEDKLSILRADKIAKEFGLTDIYVGTNYEYAILNDLKATGAEMILPLNFPDAPDVKTADDAAAVSLADLRQWEMAPSNAKYLADAGVKFAFTSKGLDHDRDFWTALQKVVMRGLTEEQALAALTTIPAQMCGVSDMVGTLEKGKLASFGIYDGDIFDKTQKLYSVWVAGKEIKLDNLPEFELRGTYDLKVGQDTWELKFTGSAERPRGNVKLGEKRARVENLETDEKQLSFTLKLSTDKYDGVLRFAGEYDNDTLSGMVALPDGEETGWQAILTAPYVDKEEGGNGGGDSDSTSMRGRPPERIKSDLPLVSRLTYPNRSYGVTEQPPQEDVLLKNAKIWTSEDEGILEGADLLIKDGKFAQIGKDLPVPDGVRVIDCTGKDVTAGIIDEHSHIAISRGVNEGSNAITSEVRIGDVINPEDISIYRLLGGGVVMSHSLHGSANPIGGQCQLIVHRWGEDAEGLKYEPMPPTIKFALGENVKQSNWGEQYTIRYPQSRMGVESIMKDGFQAAEEYERAWNDYNALSKAEKQKTIPPRNDLQLDALLDVLRGRMFIHVHSYVQSEILMLMRLAEEFGFTVQTFTHILEGYKVADEMREHGATAGSFSDWWDYKFEVYDAIAYSPALMMQKGVVVGINSDDNEMARRLNQEAGKSILYGDMSQEDAIKMVTINPAIQMRIEDQVGSIKVGKDADFVIWSGNPLSTYTKCEQTWIEGRNYFSWEKDLAERKRIAEERNALIQKILKSDSPRQEFGQRRGFEPKEKNYNCDDDFDVWRLLK